jgi:predicted RNA-binding protein associated with RNAse of E/G family
MKTITIIKQDLSGNEVWEYTGRLVKRLENKIVVEAYFDRDETIVDRLVIQKGDKFIETYFLDKWFNIYEIQDPQNASIKAWYCNISFPAQLIKNSVIFRDLALDLLVYPDGRQIVLDMDEFNSLALNMQVRSKALHALEQLHELFSSQSYSSHQMN